MNIDFKDLGDRIQADLLNFFAQKTSKMPFPKKLRIANLLTNLVLPFKFCRKDYVVNILQETLKVTKEEAERLMKLSLKNFILNSLEMSAIRFLSDDELLDKLRVEGIENLEKAHKLGKGVLIVTGHFGLWEYLTHWIVLQGYNMTSVARTQKNKYVDEWFKAMRECHGALITDSGYGLRNILRSLKQGHFLGLVMDQDSGKSGIFIKFLGKWCSAVQGPSAIALKTGSPLLPTYVFPDYKGKHLLKFYPPIFTDKYEKTLEGQQQLTQDYNMFHEKIVRKYPEQWFWLHRRWKTQPEDCPDNPWVNIAKLTLNPT